MNQDRARAVFQHSGRVCEFREPAPTKVSDGCIMVVSPSDEWISSLGVDVKTLNDDKPLAIWERLRNSQNFVTPATKVLREDGKTKPRYFRYVGSVLVQEAFCRVFDDAKRWAVSEGEQPTVAAFDDNGPIGLLVPANKASLRLVECEQEPTESEVYAHFACAANHFYPGDPQTLARLLGEAKRDLRDAAVDLDNARFAITEAEDAKQDAEERIASLRAAVAKSNESAAEVVT